MSWLDYRWAQAQMGAWLDPEHDADRIVLAMKGDPPFYGIIMLALQRADTANTARLKREWPEVCREAFVRYWTPFGLLPDDPDGLKRKVMGDRYTDDPRALRSELGSADG